MVEQALVRRILKVLVKSAVELIDHPLQILHIGGPEVVRPGRLFNEFLHALIQGLDLCEEQLVGMLQAFVVCGQRIDLVGHFSVEQVSRILRHRHALQALLDLLSESIERHLGPQH